MNGKDLNVRYRRNAYAKKRVKVIIILIVICVVLLAVAFLIIGSALKGRVDDDRAEDESRSEAEQTEPLEQHAEVPSVSSYGISLSGVSASSFSDKTVEIEKNKGSGINFVIRDSAGSELYSSSVAQGMGKQSSSSGYIGMDTLAQRAANRGLRASAIIPVNAFSKKDDLERSVHLAYDAAICAEVCRKGASDVTVLLDTEVSAEIVDELLRLADTAKGIESKTTVGIALTQKALESEGAEVLVARLWEKYDFLAFDMTKMEEGADVSAFAEKSLSAAIHYYLLRYNMRVLLPNVEGATLSSMLAVLSSKGISNWQTVVK